MGRPTRRERATAPQESWGDVFVRLMQEQLAGERDQRSHSEFLAAMRAKQSAGRLANPATAALLDRLENAIR